jgi:flagellar motor switch protein FliM
MAEKSAVTEGNPFQHARPLTAERAQLFGRTAETLAEHYEEELTRWLGEATVRAEPVENVTIPDLAGADTDLLIVKASDHLTHGVLVTDLNLALTLVSMLCGGAPVPPAELRPLSRLETGVFDLIAVPLLKAAAGLFDVGPVEAGAHVTSAAALPDSKPEPAISVSLRVSIDQLEGHLRLGLTLGQLQAYSDQLDRRIAGRLSARTNAVNVRAARAVRPVPIDLIVGFEPLQVPAGELAGLRVGDVLRTRQSVSRHLVARVGSERIFHVRAAQRGQRLVAELIAPIETDKGLA